MKALTPEYLTKILHTCAELSPTVITSFRAMIYAYHRATPRPMPWRETCDPYRILVSEIMLQQTQVERVKIKYAEFLTAFPTVRDLAEAALADVLSVWKGLGYNRRAIFLKRCAEEVVADYDGQFPDTIDELHMLPGIGPYTARAVAAFAYGVAEPLIETNIRTVFIHFFFHGCDEINDRDLMPLIGVTLDRDNPREWYYALMDYGSMIKQTHPNPGRRSRHHTTQSRFEGSNRQLRSRLLQEILGNPGTTKEQLVKGITADREAVGRNLEALQREGFLAKQGPCYYISGENKRG